MALEDHHLAVLIDPGLTVLFPEIERICPQAQQRLPALPVKHVDIQLHVRISGIIILLNGHIQAFFFPGGFFHQAVQFAELLFRFFIFPE